MELVDVYTAGKEKTGKVLARKSVFRELADDERILLVHTCIFSSDNKLLIQQRQKTKDHYPGCWDVSAGGFVLAGENSLNAAIRETVEELGLNLQSGRFVFVCCEPFGKVLDDFYNIYIDVDIPVLYLQKTEVMRVAWAERGAVLQMIRDGRFVDYAEELIAKLFDAAESRKRWETNKTT